VDDETRGIDGVYHISPRSDISKDPVIDRISDKNDFLVWIDSSERIFDSPEEFIGWIEMFRDLSVTFLFGSGKN